uniref:RING-type E3 ubiquitin transferase n=1 Tax=Rhizophora mucronata TaxID=61149 RepID=A0A2P2IV38_RHIMU
MGSEEGLKKEMEELQKQLRKKEKFEEAVASIKSIVHQNYPLASPSLRKCIYTVVCRVATILKTRYTAPGFWLAGLQLFEEVGSLTSDSSEKEHLKNCIAQAKEILYRQDNPDVDVPDSDSRGGYLFEGQLTVDPEPPLPPWLVQSNLLNSFSSILASGSSPREVDEYDPELAARAANELEGLMSNINPQELISIMEENHVVAKKAPPASKEVVANLPIITLTEELLAKLGQDPECAICKENLVVDDKMQELPCKHTFHPPCLKPWLDENNSCPICRHELRTDDHSYESWKEREKDAEEERKGAANAVRGGEYMYV